MQSAVLPGPHAGGSVTDRPTNLRLGADVLERADRVAELMKDDPIASALAGATPSRAAVLRLAIARGLEVLEREYTKKRKAPS